MKGFWTEIKKIKKKVDMGSAGWDFSCGSGMDVLDAF